MSLDDLKVWQWVLIGALAGLMVGYASTFASVERDPMQRYPMQAKDFVAQLGRRDGNKPAIRDVVVHPLHDRQNFVTGQIMHGRRYIDFGFYADSPFIVGEVHEASVDDLVRKAAGRDPQINPSYLWREATWFIVTSRMVAGMILIGGVWPLLLNLMIGAGLIPKKAPKFNYDLERFKSEPAPAAKAEPTPADIEHLNELERELEKNLKNSANDPANKAATAAAPTVASLTNNPLEPALPPAPHEDKDYRGEFYPVEKPHSSNKSGFSLVELLVVIGVIAILIAILLPVIQRARQTALVTVCANNLRQIDIALQLYLNDNHTVTFWRGANLDTDGMDWYAYGGRETGNLNLDQADYFNRIVPRPLNRYLANKTEIFHCPDDDAAPWTNDISFTIYAAPNQFEWVGNSYNFNANGYPLRPQPRHDGGLDGEKFSSISHSNDTVVFFDACLYWGFDWHYAHKGNVAFADGHVVFIPLPPQDGPYYWDP